MFGSALSKPGTSISEQIRIITIAKGFVFKASPWTAIDQSSTRNPTSQAGAVGRIQALVGVLVLIVRLIVARRAIVVRRAVGAMLTSVVPSPAIAVLPIYVAAGIAELPYFLLLSPMPLASLIPIVLIGPDQARR